MRLIGVYTTACPSSRCRMRSHLFFSELDQAPFNVQVIGDVPAGLPILYIPDMSGAPVLLKSAFTISIV